MFVILVTAFDRVLVDKVATLGKLMTCARSRVLARSNDFSMLLFGFSLGNLRLLLDLLDGRQRRSNLQILFLFTLPVRAVRAMLNELDPPGEGDDDDGLLSYRARASLVCMTCTIVRLFMGW